MREERKIRVVESRHNVRVHKDVAGYWYTRRGGIGASVEGYESLEQMDYALGGPGSFEDEETGGCSEPCKRLKGEEGTKAVALWWNRQDVLGMAEVMETDISEEEAGEVLDSFLKSHDAGYGVSWDSLSACIDEVVAERDRRRNGPL